MNDPQHVPEVLASVLSSMDIANARMLDGDNSVWKQLMSHRDDVSLLGAYGGHVRGWAEVSARFDRTAAGYAGGGGITSRENVSLWIGTDLACAVDIERHQTRLDGDVDPVTFHYRTTHVLRLEDDTWRVVLRHADPLGAFRGPAFAHARGQEAADT